jgi:hypothetical protein
VIKKTLKEGITPRPQRSTKGINLLLFGLDSAITNFGKLEGVITNYTEQMFK